MSSESRAQFARRCKVSPAAITTAIKRGSLAALPDGDVDKSSLLTIDYWRRKVGEFSGKSIDDELPPKPKAKRKRKPGKPGPKKGSTRKKNAPAKPKKPIAVKVVPAPPEPAPVEASRPPPGYEAAPPPKSAPAAKSIVAVPASAPAKTRPPSDARQLPLDLETFSIEHLGNVGIEALNKNKVFQQARTAAIKADFERGKLILRETVSLIFSRIYTVHKSELRAFEDRLTPEICAIFAMQEDSDEGVEIRKLLNMETTKILRHIQVLVAEYVTETLVENGAA